MIEAIVKLCDRLQTMTSSSSLITNNLKALITQLLAELRDLRFVYLCQVSSSVIRSYLKDIYAIEWIIEFKQISTNCRQQMDHKTRKLRRIFVTTPSPGRLTCDLSDKVGETFRQTHCFDVDINRLFIDDGEQQCDRNGWSRRPVEFLV